MYGKVTHAHGKGASGDQIFRQMIRNSISEYTKPFHHLFSPLVSCKLPEHASVITSSNATPSNAQNDLPSVCKMKPATPTNPPQRSPFPPVTLAAWTALSFCVQA